jgi:predicted nucleic acid-binding protein
MDTLTGLLLDTTVLIDLSRGNQTAADFIDQQRENRQSLFVALISAMELIVGCRNKAEVKQAQTLLADFILLPATPDSSQLAYQWLLAYNKSHGLLIPDAMIAATAAVNQLVLATDNIKDFEILPGLSVQRPY